MVCVPLVAASQSLSLGIVEAIPRWDRSRAM